MANPAYTRDLNLRQRNFVREYLIDKNATRAAIRAGYSAKTASEQGCTLLTHPKVVAELAKHEQELIEKNRVTIDEIVKGLRDMAFPEGPKEGEDRIYARDRLKAMELLAKYLGMFTEKKEISGPGGGPIEVKAKTWVELMNDEG